MDHKIKETLTWSTVQFCVHNNSTSLVKTYSHNKCIPAKYRDQIFFGGGETRKNIIQLMYPKMRMTTEDAQYLETCQFVIQENDNDVTMTLKHTDKC